MPCGNWILAHKRLVPFFQHIASEVPAINWIWPIANNDLLAKLARSHHAIGHRVGKSIDTAADVLHVKNQQVKVAKHTFRWLARFAVKRINGQSRFPVDRVLGLNHVVLNVTAYPMLRTKQCAQLYCWMLFQKVGNMM